MKRSNHWSRSGAATSFIFLLVLIAPALAWILDVDCDETILENRVLARAPRWPSTAAEWRALPRDLEAYWNDSFGLRSFLILANAGAHYLGRVSPIPSVVVGRESWLFLAGDGVVEKFRGQSPLTNAQLEDWRTTLEARQQWLTARGAYYLFLVTPDKDSVYFDRFPERFDRIGPTPLDQLLAYLREKSSVAVLDLRPALIAAKSPQRLLYLKADTHWNDQGAFIGYREIIRSLAAWYPEMKYRQLSTFATTISTSWCGDLGIMAGLCAFVNEREEQLVPIPGLSSQDLGGAIACSAGAVRCLALTTNEISSPRAVIFHDSFLMPSDERTATGAPTRTDKYRPPRSTFHLARLLAEQCSRSVFAWQQFDPELVARERPQVVVEELVERYVSRGPSHPELPPP